jgi:NitT/TauT family transport system substrate-binding protein
MAHARCSQMVRFSAAVATMAGVAAGASAQDFKTWRHGIIEAKSDAGILYMASKREFAGKLGL